MEALMKTLLLLLTGMGSGGIVEGFFGFIISARGEAASGIKKISGNPFSRFLDQRLSELMLMEWVMWFAIVLNTCLVVVTLSASPAFVAQWLDIPMGALLLITYAVALIAGVAAYLVGKKIRFRRP